jgi:3-oxoacyl-[acyl-carrier protein] reductase
MKKKALIIGSSKGIGKSILEGIKGMEYEIINPTSKELDTSKINSILKYIKRLKKIDVLILNTGGPPAKNFFQITNKEWNKYYNQLFLGFVKILQLIKINDGGYIFAVTSHTIKKPEDNLVLSNSFRVAFSSVFKTYSKLVSKKKISCINIAPGPIKTRRLEQLAKNLNKFEKKLPMKYAANPDEIGNFVKSILKNKIKYLNGVTINFDGGLSDFLF